MIDFEDLLESEMHKLNLTKDQRNTVKDFCDDGWVHVENDENGNAIVSKHLSESYISVSSDGKFEVVEGE